MYNSCRSRFCPLCQTLTKERWFEQKKAEFINTDYFHAVFTMPRELAAVARQNQALIYNLLFKSVSKTLLKFGHDEHGGQLGFMSVLHTWNQKLDYHVHLHCVIPAGVWIKETQKWKRLKKKNFLFSVKALSLIFRAKFLKGLRRLRKQLAFKGSIEYLGHPLKWQDFLDQLYAKSWVVYAKKSLRGAHQVVEYLGRYTHRVAISNYRLVKLEQGQVFFKYRDRKDDNKEKTLSLPVLDFLRRFLLHILPHKFTKIRYHGFLSNRYKKKNLHKIFEQLKMTPAPAQSLSVEDFVRKIFGREIHCCPRCQNETLQKRELDRPP